MRILFRLHLFLPLFHECVIFLYTFACMYHISFKILSILCYSNWNLRDLMFQFLCFYTSHSMCWPSSNIGDNVCFCHTVLLYPVDKVTWESVPLYHVLSIGVFIPSIGRHRGWRKDTPLLSSCQVPFTASVWKQCLVLGSQEFKRRK